MYKGWVGGRGVGGWEGGGEVAGAGVKPKAD